MDPRSLENPGIKFNAAFLANHIMDFDRIAANFTILDIRLASHRCVQHHGDLFPAIRTGEEVFHQWRQSGWDVAGFFKPLQVWASTVPIAVQPNHFDED
jgi:hypothetical protein